MPRVAWVALVDVHSHDVERHWGPALQPAKQVKQRVAVLAAADGDEEAVALLDHREVGHGARKTARQFPLESLQACRYHRQAGASTD